MSNLTFGQQDKKYGFRGWDEERVPWLCKVTQGNTYPVSGPQYEYLRNSLCNPVAVKLSADNIQRTQEASWVLYSWNKQSTRVSSSNPTVIWANNVLIVQKSFESHLLSLAPEWISTDTPVLENTNLTSVRTLTIRNASFLWKKKMILLGVTPSIGQKHHGKAEKKAITSLLYEEQEFSRT